MDRATDAPSIMTPSKEARSDSPNTLHALVFETCGCPLHSIFLMMTATAVRGTAQVFGARRVSKQWKAYIDEDMSDAEWQSLFYVHVFRWALTVRWRPTLTPNWDALTNSEERLLKAYTAAQEPVCPGAFRHALQEAIKRGAPSAFSKLHHSLALLDAIADIAVAAACDGPRFAQGFDNLTRGYAYFAVHRATHNRPEGDSQSNNEALIEWWRAKLVDVQSRVEQRMESRSMNAKTMAKLEVQSFVDKMVAIPFHRQKDAQYELLGRSAMERWSWPIDSDGFLAAAAAAAT